MKPPVPIILNSISIIILSFISVYLLYRVSSLSENLMVTQKVVIAQEEELKAQGLLNKAQGEFNTTIVDILTSTKPKKDNKKLTLKEDEYAIY